MSAEINKENTEEISNTAEGKTTRPIDSPEKVPTSKDKKIDEDFPGYPHHPARNGQAVNGNSVEDVSNE